MFTKGFEVVQNGDFKLLKGSKVHDIATMD